MSKKLDVSKFLCKHGKAKVSFVQEFLQPTVQTVQTALKDHAEKKHKEKKHDKAMVQQCDAALIRLSHHSIGKCVQRIE